MNESFDRLLNLAQKTNSRLIVYDRFAGKHFVVLGIDDFEKLSGEIEPETKSVSFDADADNDRELIQKLNEEIEDLRTRAQKQDADQTLQKFPEEEIHNNSEPELSHSAIGIKSSPESSSVTWHKFGDVLARYQPVPKASEIRYEPAESKETERSQSLEDDPVFLEEPVE